MKRFLYCALFGALLFTPAFTQESISLADLKQQALRDVEARQTFTQQMVDQIFSYAELGFHEYETTKYLTGVLAQNGFKVEQGVANIPTAWTATWGNGKPVIAFITDIDCIPRASQKPGVAFHDPLVKDAPGHGEGHNSGMAVNITAALTLKQLMQKHKLSGTIKQGVGRLIRSASDRGVIALLDARLLTKGYGPQFIESLPPCRITQEIDEVEVFFEAE